MAIAITGFNTIKFEIPYDDKFIIKEFFKWNPSIDLTPYNQLIQ